MILAVFLLLTTWFFGIFLTIISALAHHGHGRITWEILVILVKIFILPFYLGWILASSLLVCAFTLQKNKKGNVSTKKEYLQPCHDPNTTAERRRHQIHPTHLQHLFE